MKKLLTLTLTLLLASSVSFFSSCGTKGDPGAQGPQGNANVDAYTFTVPLSLWNNGVSAVVPDDQITEDIVTNGFVQVYAATDLNSDIWAPLPYYDGLGTYSFNYEAGDVEIDYSSNTSFASTKQVFKVIAVAGSVRKMMQQSNINVRDYNAVNSYLKMKNLTH